jgi:hypothetical protein
MPRMEDYKVQEISGRKLLGLLTESINAAFTRKNPAADMDLVEFMISTLK